MEVTELRVDLCCGSASLDASATSVGTVGMRAHALKRLLGAVLTKKRVFEQDSCRREQTPLRTPLLLKRTLDRSVLPKTALPLSRCNFRVSGFLN